jgi:ribosomal protein L37AE/L43A
MWQIFLYLAILIGGAAAGYFISGGRVRFIRGATRQREECPGCGAVGVDKDGTKGDAKIYECNTCRVFRYRVFPYDVNW